EPALGGDDGSFGEKARRLKTPVGKRVPEHTEEAQNLLAAVHRRVRCDEVGVVAPRFGVRVPHVERLDMPFDDALGISHQVVPPIGCRARILALCDGLLTIGGERRHGLALSRESERTASRARLHPHGRRQAVSSRSGPVTRSGRASTETRTEEESMLYKLAAYIQVAFA